MKNLYEHIASLAQTQPTKAALVACDEKGVAVQTITYGELPGRLADAAGGLKALGLGVGSRVALELPTSIDQLIVSWAAWASGVVTVPLDTRRDTTELVEFKTKSSGATVVLDKLPAQSGSAEWMPELSHTALILFTSGTTAHPKGAELTLENLVVNAQGIGEWLKVTNEDRFMVNLPLHHINSTTFCLTTLLAGGTVIVPPTYSNSNFWTQAASSGATFTSIVQSIVFDQLQRKAEFEKVKDALKFSRIQIGSAPVVALSAREFIETFNIPLYQGYGQTETALRVTGVPMDLPHNLYMQLVDENSIGVAMGWADVEIVDEDGKTLGEGEEGELVVKGSAVMKGYIGGEEAFKNGYFLTGDIGLWRTIDGRKFFTLKGRKKEIVIKGGVNISPVAVENNLKKVSSDVEQVYVIGLPDDRYGEVVGAVVCWKEGVDHAQAMRKLKSILLWGSPHLSAYETPAYLTTLAAKDLPLTSTGKVQRVVLKQQLPVEKFESLYEWQEDLVLLQNPSSLFEKSLALYNHCWQPLTMTEAEYKKFTSANHTLLAKAPDGSIAGQIAFTKSEPLTCVSICSANFVPKPIGEVVQIPTPDEVKEYLDKGLDPVINFHTKLGAKMVEIIPNGRPQDKSAQGYMVRMRYAIAADTTLDRNASVSNRLIQAVLMFAQDVGLTNVEALSRPGGLANYLTKK